MSVKLNYLFILVTVLVRN